MERFSLGITKIVYFIIMMILVSCYNTKYPETEKEYLNTTLLDKDDYINDSLYLLKVIEYMIDNNIKPFKPSNQFDSLTKIEIDTILYSPDTLKMFAFIITKNANIKNPYMDRKDGFHYNECCVLALRNSTDSLWKVIPLLTLQMTYYNDKKYMSERFHKHYFREMSKRSMFGYNFNDIRFWNSLIWKKVKYKTYYTSKTDTI